MKIINEPKTELFSITFYKSDIKTKPKSPLNDMLFVVVRNFVGTTLNDLPKCSIHELRETVSDELRKIDRLLLEYLARKNKKLKL